MSTSHIGIHVAAALVGVGVVLTTFLPADPAPSSITTRVEAGGSAQSEAVVPMSSLREDWSAVPIEPMPATF